MVQNLTYLSKTPKTSGDAGEKNEISLNFSLQFTKLLFLGFYLSHFYKGTNPNVIYIHKTFSIKNCDDLSLN